MNWLNILKLILGEAEQIVPIFVHNPKSQQIEAVIATTADEAVSIASQLIAPVVPATPPTPPTA